MVKCDDILVSRRKFPLSHELVVMATGKRSGLPIIIALHSTVLGPAVGGCRMWIYSDWRAGLADALPKTSLFTRRTWLSSASTPQWAGGLPRSVGGSGEPAEPTSVGVFASIEATARHLFGSADLRGRSVVVVDWARWAPDSPVRSPVPERS